MKYATFSLMVVAAVVLGSPVHGQEPGLDSLLRFERRAPGDSVPGWGGGPAGTIHFDTTEVHGGRGAARLERDARSPGRFTALMKRLPLDFAGGQLELHGYLRTEAVTGGAALFRYWNIIEYWYPDRDVIPGDWHTVLADVLPDFVAASSWDDYRLALLALIARVHDTHANLWSDLDVRPPRGDCAWPVALRFVQGQAVVTSFGDSTLGPATGLEIGDAVTAVDGRPVDSLVAAWLPYYAASNRVTQLRDIARSLPRGACGEIVVTIERDHRSRTVRMARRVPADRTPAPHDRPGEAFQLLSPEVAYLKLSAVRAGDVPAYLKRASGTRGLVIDIRNYPSEFVVFALGSYLVDQPTPFARFTAGDPHNPGAFTWTEPLVLKPATPAYAGKVVILVDESSVSQAEYTAMAFRARSGALVVGSTTAGADGNVSTIPLPGGSRTLISGIGVFYPDKRPTQRVGIVPDIPVRPTIAGIREGRDEVLEAALRQILGPDADPTRIRRLAAPRP